MPQPVPAPIQLERLQSYGVRDVGNDSLATSLRLRGDLDVVRLRRAVEAAVARHDALRSRFAVRGPLAALTGGPRDLDVVTVTVADPDVSVSFAVEDAAEDAAPEVVAASGVAPFDLEHGPRVRVLLLRLGAGDWVFTLVVDHLVLDRIGLDLLAAEVAAYYAGADPDERPPAPSYAVYATAQWDLLAGPAGERRLGYWGEWVARAGVLPPADLGTGSATATGRATVVGRALDPDTAERLASGARAERTTPFNVVAAALLDGIGARQGRDAAGLVVSLSNRTEAATRDLVGLVAVALPLWVETGGDFPGLVRRTTRAMGATLSHGVPLLTAWDAYLSAHPAAEGDRATALNRPTVELYFDSAGGGGGGGAGRFGDLLAEPYAPPRPLELSAGGCCFLAALAPRSASFATVFADETYGTAAVGVLDGALSTMRAWATGPLAPAPSG